MKETLHITVEIREIYGKQVYYPHCVNSKTFASIAGTKTLTDSTLRRIKKLGYGISITHITPDIPTIFD